MQKLGWLAEQAKVGWLAEQAKVGLVSGAG